MPVSRTVFRLDSTAGRSCEMGRQDAAAGRESVVDDSQFCDALPDVFDVKGVRGHRDLSAAVTGAAARILLGGHLRRQIAQRAGVTPSTITRLAREELRLTRATALALLATPSTRQSDFSSGNGSRHGDWQSTCSVSGRGGGSGRRTSRCGAARRRWPRWK